MTEPGPNIGGDRGVGPEAWRGPADPGSHGAARIAMTLVIVLIGAVAVLQQLGASALVRGSASQPAAPAEAVATIAPPSEQEELITRMMVKLQRAMGSPAIRGQLITRAEDVGGPEERLRAIVAEAAIAPPTRADGRATSPEAVRRLRALAAELPDGAPLAEDVADLERLYSGEALDDEALARLADHHGYAGELAGVFGLDESDSTAAQVLGGGGVLLAVLGGTFFVGGLALVAGIALLITGVVMHVQRGPRGIGRFIPPSPGGSIAIETVAVFVAAFLLFKALSGAVARLAGEDVAMWFALIGQWTLLLALLWPRVRGVELRRGLGLLGLHRGAGVAREIGSGIVGYLACLPLLAMGMAVSVMLLAIQQVWQRMAGRPPAAPPENPIIEIVGGSGSIAMVVLVYLLATLWAPVAEETIFRGGFYRHLRSRWAVVPAAGVAALGFGLMHGYPLLLLGPVIGLGFGFALLREWRGSLIAPMVAHGLHNGIVLAVLITVLWAVG